MPAAAAAASTAAADAAHGGATWGALALGVMGRVADALGPVVAVLLRYKGKADKQRDESLLKDTREVRRMARRMGYRMDHRMRRSWNVRACAAG